MGCVNGTQGGKAESQKANPQPDNKVDPSKPSSPAGEEADASEDGDMEDLGISRSYLTYFCNSRPQLAEGEERELIQKTVIPTTAHEACSYARWMYDRKDESGRRYAGKMSYFVISCCPVKVLLDAITKIETALSGADPEAKNAYYFIDSFCRNQNDDVVDVERIQAMINKAKGVILILSPFYEPEVIFRIRCLMEIDTAITFQKKLHIVVPDSEMDLFSEMVKTDIEKLMLGFAHIDSRRAIDWTHESTAKIREILKQTSRLDLLNGRIIDVLRQWLAKEGAQVITDELIDEHIEKKSTDVLDKQVYLIDWLFHATSCHADALDFHTYLLDAYTKRFGAKSLRTIKVLERKSALLRKLDYSKKALNHFEKLLNVQLEVLAVQHPRTMATLSGLGALLKRTGKLDEAIEIEKKVVEIKTAVYGEKSSKTLSSRFALGRALAQGGHFQKSEQVFKELYTDQIANYGPNHVDTLKVEYELAYCQHRMDKESDALELVQNLIAKQEVEFPEDPFLEQSKQLLYLIRAKLPSNEIAGQAGRRESFEAGEQETETGDDRKTLGAVTYRSYAGNTLPTIAGTVRVKNSENSGSNIGTDTLRIPPADETFTKVHRLSEPFSGPKARGNFEEENTEPQLEPMAGAVGPDGQPIIEERFSEARPVTVVHNHKRHKTVELPKKDLLQATSNHERRKTEELPNVKQRLAQEDQEPKTFVDGHSEAMVSGRRRRIRRRKRTKNRIRTTSGSEHHL